MKLPQKLEVAFGILPLVIVLISIYVEVTSTETRTSATLIYDWILTFTIIVLPAILVAVGAFLHATKQSIFGLVVIPIFGSWLILFFFPYFLFVPGRQLSFFSIIRSSTALFALTTIFLAIYNIDESQ